MKFRFVWIGKTRDKNWKALQEEYLRRLSHFVRCEIAEIRDSASHETTEIEGKRILQIVNPKDFVCLLEIGGKTLSSVQLAREIENWQIRGLKSVTFVIGGAEGTSSEVGEIADFRLSLSFMTFTHELARVILLEQLYRSYTIIHGYPYQK
ncbi:MAG TPA: 23S rRNA (pseudouridine(1915)-N(3))-methyltransferase RlmH [Pyrinomonadaceae bacterium]|nr:23S rRNA (pseudouridine(1915)-N(3))-methyltransferase RlmH [Pyrinomonadaceae bacterium]